MEKEFPSQLISFGCAKMTPEGHRHYYESARFGLWIYTMNKILDLLDTVFFVLRKKQSHVTVLHVYHHVGTLLLSWILLKYFVSQEGALVGVLNTFIHAVMWVSPNTFLWWSLWFYRFFSQGTPTTASPPSDPPTASISGGSDTLRSCKSPNSWSFFSTFYLRVSWAAITVVPSSSVFQCMESSIWHCS